MAFNEFSQAGSGASLAATMRQDTVGRYAESLSETDRAAAKDIYSQLIAKRPLANTVCMLATAAHQEAPNIEHTIQQYAGQVGAGNFTVVVGLNCPSDRQHDDSVRQSYEAVERAKRAHPDLDLRSCFKTYANPTMGRIRRDLWNGIIWLGQAEGVMARGRRDVLAMDHGADLQYLPPGFIKDIQDHYDRDIIPKYDQGLPHIGPHHVLPLRTAPVRHAASTAHPNSSRAIAWHEFLMDLRGVGYEAGFVIPMSLYAYNGGHNPDDISGESVSLVQKRGGNLRPMVLPGEPALTSPRRFLQRIDAHGFQVWQGDDFSHTESYRDQDAEPVPDISRERFAELIDSERGQVRYVIDGAIQRAYKEYRPDSLRVVSEDDPGLLQFVDAKLCRLASMFRITLRDVIQAPEAVAGIDELFEPKSLMPMHDQILKDLAKEAAKTADIIAMTDDLKAKGKIKRITSI